MTGQMNILRGSFFPPVKTYSRDFLSELVMPISTDKQNTYREHLLRYPRCVTFQN
jgi:hypothetical protein